MTIPKQKMTRMMIQILVWTVKKRYAELLKCRQILDQRKENLEKRKWWTKLQIQLNLKGQRLQNLKSLNLVSDLEIIRPSSINTKCIWLKCKNSRVEKQINIFWLYKYRLFIYKWISWFLMWNIIHHKWKRKAHLLRKCLILFSC